MPTAQKFNCWVFFSLCDHVKCTTWMKCEEKDSTRFIFHSLVSWNSWMETGRVMLNSVYGAFSSVSLPKQNSPVLKWESRDKGMNSRGINLRFHEFCYGFCREYPERIGNVTMMLYCFLFYLNNTTSQVGNTSSFIDKRKEKHPVPRGAGNIGSE